MKKDKTWGTVYIILAVVFLFVVTVCVIQLFIDGVEQITNFLPLLVYLTFFLGSARGAFLKFKPKKITDKEIETIYAYPQGREKIIAFFTVAVIFAVMTIFSPKTDTIAWLPATIFSLTLAGFSVVSIAQGQWIKIVISDEYITYKGKTYRTEDLFITLDSVLRMKGGQNLIFGAKYYTREEIEYGAYAFSGFKFFVAKEERLTQILKRCGKNFIEMTTPEKVSDRFFNIIAAHNQKIRPSEYVVPPDDGASHSVD